MNPELEKLYQDSVRPFIEGGGAITEREAKMRSWRYFLEINSACNLSCPTCTKGNKPGYEHQTGLMDEGLMLRCIDKIYSENPEAIVFLYGNSEPFIHPRLPECIAAVKKRGLRCEFSTNLNYIQRVSETLAARPDFIIVSLSGFTQEIYVRGHAGGNIERVKANMRELGEANKEHKIPISVNYHIYTDNGHELEPMREYAKSCGLDLFTSTARAISMENSVQYLRSLEGYPEFEIDPGRPDWNQALPPTSQKWIDTMARLKIPPERARGMYEKYPVQTVCSVGAGSIFTFIRHDGKTQLCACTADRRMTLGDYLTTPAEQLIEQRTGHAFCKQCIKYRLNLYFMIVTRDLWD